MTPAILNELSCVDPTNITLLVGTGMHRPNTGEEFERMLGSEIVRIFRVVNHDCHDLDNMTNRGQNGQRKRHIPQSTVRRGRRSYSYRVHRAALFRRIQRRSEGDPPQHRRRVEYQVQP